MNQKWSGSRIKRELSRLVAGHRLTVSEASKNVRVRTDSYPEVASVVGFAQSNAIPVFPVPEEENRLPENDWHIRLDLAGLNSAISYLKDSRILGIQAGIDMESLVDWVYDKQMELAVMPEFFSRQQLWEFLLSTQAGRYGPGMGTKWDQVVAVKAVLPNGRLFQNTVAPARAAGPDFTRLILSGGGRFGIPLEVHIRTIPSPPRKEHLAFGLKHLEDGLGPAWEIVEKARPEFLELGTNRNLELKGLPTHFLLVELWGEGKELSFRKEAVRKAMHEIGEPVDIPYEVLLGFDETYGFRSQSSHQFHVHRKQAPAALSAIQEYGCESLTKVRLLGFLDHHICVTVDCGNARREGMSRVGAAPYFAPESEALRHQMALQLDPAQVFSGIPTIWGESA